MLGTGKLSSLRPVYRKMTRLPGTGRGPPGRIPLAERRKQNKQEGWTLKRYLVPALLLLASPLQADQKMDIMLQQGTSAYEEGNYQQAMNHFTAGLIYSLQSDNPPAYPASYLCGIWYHGKGVEQDRTRALRACDTARGDKSDYQMELFQEALEKNATSESTQTFKKAMKDAAEALKWYLGETASSSDSDDNGN